MICGCVAATTIGARNVRPAAVVAPRTLPFNTSMLATGESVRIVAPNDSAERRIASLTAPMPPIG